MHYNGSYVKNAIPIPVQRALRKLGKDIADIRRRRRLPAKLLAERAGVSPRTVGSIEKGQATVAIGSYIAVIFALGMIDRVSDLMDVRHDVIGLSMEEERLPQRVRLPKKKDQASGQ